MSDRTGELVRALADGVRQDLEDIAVGLEAIRAKVETLGESARAINGLKDDCASWRNHLDTVLGSVREEAVAVPAKLVGAPVNPIVSTVNADHAEAVKEARRKAS